MILTHRPLQLPWGQPFTEQRRGRGTFKATWSATLDLLDRELWHLEADAAVLQVDVTDAEVRLDGQLRANARPNFPGVRLVADTPQGTLLWQTDACELWQHNVRSIALGLEALRAVDRYGITTAGEQYKGWLQLEAGAGPSSMDAAAEVIWHWSRLTPTGALPDSMHYRAARANAHPDRNGGMRTGWDAVEAAGKTLGLVR